MLSDFREEQSKTRVNTFLDYEITGLDSVILFTQFNIGVPMWRNTHLLALVKWMGSTVSLLLWIHLNIHRHQYTCEGILLTPYI